MHEGKYRILLVDDSEDDRFFMRRVLHQNPKFTVIWEAGGGLEAMSYLAGQEKFQDRMKYPLPDLLLIDLKMPLKTGYDVLEWLRLQTFPRMMVAIISGSFLPEDITRCRTLGADAYFKKSAIREEQILMLDQIRKGLEKYSAGPVA